MTEEHPIPAVHSLRQNALWGVVANVFYAGGRFLIFALPAKFLPAEQMGWFAWALAVVTPLAYLVHLELRLVLATEVSTPIAPGYYVTTRWLGNIALLGMLAVLWITASWNIAAGWVILGVGVIRVLESWADLCLGVLQKHERMGRVAVSQLAKMGLLLVWIAGVWLWVRYGWGRHILWVITGWAIAMAAVLMRYDLPQAKRWESMRPQWSWSVQTALMRRAWPLGVFLALTGLNDTIVRYFVGHYKGPAQVAYLTGMTFLVTGLVVLQNGINQSVLPRLAMYYAEDRTQFRRLFIKLISFAGCLAILFVVVVVGMGGALLAAFYRDEYVQGRALFGLIALGGGILAMAMVLGDTLVACQRFKTRMLAVVGGVAANFLVCWWGVPSYGLMAAAWALFASAVVSAAISAWALHQLLSQHIPAEGEMTVHGENKTTGI